MKKNKFYGNILIISILFIVFAQTSFGKNYKYNKSNGDYTFIEEGVHTVEVCNSFSVCNMGTFYIDRTAPTCGTITQNPLATVWTKNNVTGSVPCSDPNYPNSSGCQSPSFSDIFSSNGNKNIAITDKAGNLTNCPITITNIDKTPPSVSRATPSSEPYSKTTAIYFTYPIPTDTLSGIKECKGIIHDYTTDVKTPINVQLNGRTDYAGQDGHQYVFSYYCTDKVDNNSSWTVWSKSVLIDATPPFLDASDVDYTPKKIFAYVNDPKPTAESVASGISISKYRWNNADCWNGTNFNDNRDTRPDWGVHTLYLCAEDKAGNQTTWNKEYAIDNIPPTCGTSWLTKNNINVTSIYTQGPVIPHVNCNDATPGSGCVQPIYDGTPIVNHNQTQNIIIKDNAGNTKTCTSPASLIDRLPPSCVISGGTGEGGRFLIGNSIQATCSDTASDANNGISGCQANPDPVVITNPPQTSVSLSVKDIAGNIKDCSQYGDGNIIDEIRLQYVEIRGLSETKTTTSTRTEVANLIKQNVANLTRNQIPNSSNNTLNWNLNNSNIAYYVGDVTLGASFTISGKKTIIIQDGSLTLNGEITYTDTNSILGIIVLGTGTKGNVTIGANVKNIAAVLFAEGTLFSADQNNENQLYWKGTVISDNTIGGYNNSPQKCPQKISSCNTANALAGDLNYFRSYHQATTSGQKANDPLGKHAPFIIEYDNSLTTKTPYGFEASSDVSFQEIVR